MKIRSKLSRHEIDLLRQLVEQAIARGRHPYAAYREAAERFEKVQIARR